MSSVYCSIIMPFNTFIRAPVGPDVSRPAPIDRPVGNSLTQINLLKLIIGLRWIFALRLNKLKNIIGVTHDANN